MIFGSSFVSDNTEVKNKSDFREAGKKFEGNVTQKHKKLPERGDKSDGKTKMLIEKGEELVREGEM